ncbi:hypothetical protein KUTeg_019758 [Tegillarca granosa]|uniref:Uncharacterized protein n=1 Tax=Tegillarca granosa TaxID=220873 RepID=A0ABQ9EHG6_TEGGR|nr:hypothetical protein KUTeg_019758 [Tegillarca granosa]
MQYIMVFIVNCSYTILKFKIKKRYLYHTILKKLNFSNIYIYIKIFIIFVLLSIFSGHLIECVHYNKKTH